MKAYSAAVEAELLEGSITPILFVSVEISAQTTGPDRTDYFCSASSPVTWNGQTWAGVGGIVSVGTIKESDDLVANGFAFTISGLTQSATAAFLTDEIQGRPCTCWFGLIGANGVIADPEIEVTGRLDSPTRSISEEGEIIIQIPVESEMMRWALPNGSRFTDAEQQIISPGDTFFSRVAKLSESYEIAWPAKEHFRQ